MEKNNQLSVLWLPAWYPSALDAFNGDFIQRHARAVALYCKVQVICMIPDSEGKITRSVKVTETVSGNLSETIIYYNTRSILPGVAGKLFSVQKYLRIYKKAVRQYLLKNGKTPLVHLHIADKNGLIALWLKKSRNIPFILSEHWTIYLVESDFTFSMEPAWFRSMWKRIIKQCSGISTVSKYLGSCMGQWGTPVHYQVIPNVVDHKIFFSEETEKGGVPLFMHISLLNYQKNFEGILEAFSIVKKAGYLFRLSVFGPATEDLHQLVSNLELSQEVQFHGELPQPVLAGHLRKATALVHFSRYETFGCVVAEAIACGIPAITSDQPAHREIITEGINGFFAEDEHVPGLAEKIIGFIKQPPQTSKKDMHEASKKRYGYEVVGKTFYDWYRSVIGN